MWSTTENINRRVETAIPMTRFSISEDDEDTPLTIKRPRLSDVASQSQSQSQSQSRVVIEDVESDSDGFEYEESEEEDEEVEVFEHIESGDDAGDDGEAVPVPEGRNQWPQVTSSTAVSLLRGFTDVVVANRTADIASPVLNSVNGELQVVFTDPDVLDCPICLEPLSPPVFQCENGHIACSSCCSKVKRKCPSCCMPIGYNRCRAVEKIIESVKVSCKNAQYGCKKTVTYSKKSEHEQMCPDAVCYCPHASCPFSGSSKSMYLHFGIQHAVSTIRFTYNTTFFVHVEPQQKHVFLQEQHESVIFILNHQVKQHGRALSVDCVGPNALKTCFEYHITARRLESTLSLQSIPEMYTKWSEHPIEKTYLTIPSDFFCCTWTLPLPLQLCIKKVPTPL